MMDQKTGVLGGLYGLASPARAARCPVIGQREALRESLCKIEKNVAVL